MKTLIVAILVLTGAFAQAADKPQPASDLKFISALDVSRYMGTWYKTAKFPAWFQKKCVADTRAEYILQPDGGVQVINRCRQGSSEMKESLGSGRQIGDATSSKLEVRFAPAWLAVLPSHGVGRLLGHRPGPGLPARGRQRAQVRVSVYFVQKRQSGPCCLRRFAGTAVQSRL